MIFANVKGLRIPEGQVSRITDAIGRVLWAVPSTPGGGGGTDEPGYSGDPSTFPVMAERFTWYKSAENRNTITEIEFKDAYTPTSAYDEAWYADEDNSGSITCYRIGTKIIIAGNGSGGINANPNSGLMFWEGSDNYCKNLKTIYGLPLLNTSNVTKMGSMFSDCEALTSLNLSGFDTSNVTRMNGMFSSCYSLTSLDLSSFNTSNVTDMYYMFDGCSALTSLNLSSFDTSNVTTMWSMFEQCSSLTSLDLSNFDTSNVTNMSSMFRECYLLISLDLSNFDTSNVTKMDDMFFDCQNLINVNLSSFDTSKVTAMNEMFEQCYSLTSLDLSSFDTNKVTKMYYMFNDCSKLTTIYVSRDKWVIRGDCDTTHMFTGCGTSTLTYI